MRIAFYAPLKPPSHAVPSGDRRVARLLIEALERAGHEVQVASTLRTYEPAGDLARQFSLRDEGLALSRGLVSDWAGGGRGGLPDLWFTYHVYYKAPDWIGPAVSSALGIPYVIAEASYAPKRAHGPWALGHAATGDAIRAASLVLCPITDDLACVASHVGPHARMMLLPPFLDPAIYAAAAAGKASHRKRLQLEYQLDPSLPWIVVAAMMRVGDKLSSYRKLASALERLTDVPWQILVAGDGPARSEVEAEFRRVAPGRSRFLGELQADALASVYGACDLCLWPAVNEAYGMALLEAQAAGVPVVSQAVRGVPDVVCDGRTGLLAAQGDDAGMAELARALLTDHARRAQMGRAAARAVAGERSVVSTAATLHRVLAEVRAQCATPPGVAQR